MKKYLILIAGSPATGKTFLVKKIQQAISEVFIITPDEGKEILADSVGFSNKSQKEDLENKVWKFYYSILDLYMEVGKRIILSEYPFSDKQRSRLDSLSEKYEYEVITIRLVADFETLWSRRKLRDIEPTRHLSHIMNNYHKGDQLENRNLANALITKEEFREITENRKYDEFELGKLYEVDVSDYSKVNYDNLIAELINEIQCN